MREKSLTICFIIRFLVTSLLEMTSKMVSDVVGLVTQDKMALKNQKGITLIEMIVFIIVAAVVMPVIISPVLTLLKDSTKPEKAVTANFLAQQRLEEITKDDYPDITPTPSGFTTYAVVDATDFPDYQWCWNIEYVKSDLTTAGVYADGYIKITVKVKDTYNTDYIYYTLATKRANDP